MFDEIDPRSPTPLYEQIASRIRVAIASDDLKPGDSLPSVIAEILAGAPPDVRRAAPDTPPALADLCRRALSRDPAGRPASAAAFAQELASAAGLAAPASAESGLVVVRVPATLAEGVAKAPGVEIHEAATCVPPVLEVKDPRESVLRTLKHQIWQGL